MRCSSSLLNSRNHSLIYSGSQSYTLSNFYWLPSKYFSGHRAYSNEQNRKKPLPSLTFYKGIKISTQAFKMKCDKSNLEESKDSVAVQGRAGSSLQRRRTGEEERKKTSWKR